jgi:hypothetical protein
MAPPPAGDRRTPVSLDHRMCSRDRQGAEGPVLRDERPVDRPRQGLRDLSPGRAETEVVRLVVVDACPDIVLEGVAFVSPLDATCRVAVVPRTVGPAQRAR